MKIYKRQSNCGKYQKPKGHLDTQMYPECENTPADRDIVKKTRKRREQEKKTKKKASNNGHFRNKCPFCLTTSSCRCPMWMHEATGVELTHDLCFDCKKAAARSTAPKTIEVAKVLFNLAKKQSLNVNDKCACSIKKECK